MNYTTFDDFFAGKEKALDESFGLEDVYQEDHTAQQVDMMLTRLVGLLSVVPEDKKAVVAEKVLADLRDRLIG